LLYISDFVAEAVLKVCCKKCRYYGSQLSRRLKDLTPAAPLKTSQECGERCKLPSGVSCRHRFWCIMRGKKIISQQLLYAFALVYTEVLHRHLIYT